MHINRKKQNDAEAVANRMLAFYEGLQHGGTSFFMDGEAVRLKNIKRNVLMEESPYMADYVTDDCGQIIQVRFDKVDTE